MVETQGDRFNPAKRLAAILRAGKAIDNSQTNGRALCQILRVPDTKDPLFYNQVGKLILLIDQILVDLEKSPIDPTRLKAPLENIKNHIIANLMQLNSQWAQFINAISNDTILLLEFTSDQLDANKIEPSLSKNEIDEEIDHISQAMMKLSADKSIDDEVKRALLELLGKVQFGLNQYKLFGVEAFYEVFRDAFFFIAEKKDIIELLKVDEHREYISKILQKVSSLMSTLKTSESLHRYITLVGHAALTYSQRS